MKGADGRNEEERGRRARDRFQPTRTEARELMFSILLAYPKKLRWRINSGRCGERTRYLTKNEQDHLRVRNERGRTSWRDRLSLREKADQNNDNLGG